ncbi:hypothetical protein V1508DRAFT_75747 [Lipomyces doorenjongii]|uniref:uncharacterized protein n=1 Tax=Lipomyces doorenjongii TaxID=383834 RepID=UPI0034CFF1BD
MSFTLLKRMFRQILEDSRSHTSTSFQVIRTKGIAEDEKRNFFDEVQEEPQIWCKVLWIACLAVTKECPMTRYLLLTPGQTASAKALMEALDIIGDCNIAIDHELYTLSMETAVELCTVCVSDDPRLASNRYKNFSITHMVLQPITCNYMCDRPTTLHCYVSPAEPINFEFTQRILERGL